MSQKLNEDQMLILQKKLDKIHADNTAYLDNISKRADSRLSLIEKRITEIESFLDLMHEQHQTPVDKEKKS